MVIELKARYKMIDDETQTQGGPLEADRPDEDGENVVFMPGYDYGVFWRVADRMAALGFEFCGQTLKALGHYAQGGGVCLLGNAGVGKTFFFDCLLRAENELRAERLKADRECREEWERRVRAVDSRVNADRIVDIELRGFALECSNDYVRLDEYCESGIVRGLLAEKPVPHKDFPGMVKKCLGCAAFADNDELISFASPDESPFLLLDDLGAEPPFNDYGRRLELVSYIINLRYNSPCVTHITSNLTAAQIARRYDASTWDRIREMTRGFELKGESRRKAGSRFYRGK